MSSVKVLVKKRDISFLFPNNIEKSTEDEAKYAMKAIGYFRNYPLFKIFYTLINKSYFMTIDQLKKSCDEIGNIGKMSNSFSKQIEGFFACIEKSKKSGVYNIVNFFVKPFIVDEQKKENKLQKSIRDYYNSGKDINVALIKSGKVIKINSSNVVRFIYRMK